MAKQHKSNAELLAEVEALKAKLGETTMTKIEGTYKGHAFDDGHKKCRNQSGEICDTQMVMDAANDAANAYHEDACAILDWLIDLGYAHLSPAKAE